MTKMLIVVGTEGAGKTSILSSLADMKADVKIFNLGDEMLKLAEKEKGIDDRDKIRTMGTANISKWRDTTLKEILKQDGNIILDTHTTIKFGMGFLPGFTISDLDLLRDKTAGLLYINANTADIINRRLSDSARVRENGVSEDAINTYKNVEVSLSAFASAYLNIPLYMIYNMEGRLAEAQEEARAIVRQVFG